MKTKWDYFLENKFEFFMENLYLPLGGLFILFLIVIGFFCYQETEKLYKQCLEDGKKEYECYALIYRGSRR